MVRDAEDGEVTQPAADVLGELVGPVACWHAPTPAGQEAGNARHGLIACAATYSLGSDRVEVTE